MILKVVICSPYGKAFVQKFYFSEMWYLVKYEDDENMRVLGQDEIRHIFEGEDEDEIEAGDIVNAIWLPNGLYYDAKVLQKGSEFHFFFH